MSGINLYNLSYSPSDVAQSQTIGSYVLAGDDGTAIGHVSDALKVSLTNASIVVTATDLDIRDLAFATDKVDVSGSSVTVSATNLDIRDLAFATDKVDVSGSSVSISGTVSTSASGNANVKASAISVTTSATQLVAGSPLANRRIILVVNNSSNTVYLGGSAVTTATGVPLGKHNSVEVECSTGLYAIAATGTNDIRILEAGL